MATWLSKIKKNLVVLEKNWAVLFLLLFVLFRNHSDNQIVILKPGIFT